jgi:UDP-N-acetylmuramate--alanine ligase
MYKKNKHIHFIGIGGIGMSGIAEVLRQQGHFVSGCDLSQKSKILDHLEQLGCPIYHGHDESHIEDADVLVYSSAISHDNPEIKAALEKGIPVIPRAIMLAELMRMKYGIAIAGAHGKTTTTSITSHILIEAKLDPTIIIGGVLKNISTHAKLGSGSLLVAEADESDRSLLYLNPSVAVVTSIDAEHLDTYKDIHDVKETFKNFLARLPFYGKAFVCIDDPNVRSILPLPHIPTIKYGLSNDADLMGNIIELNKTTSIFNVYEKIAKSGNTKSFTHKLLGKIELNMPGEHNVLNSLASIALALEFDVPFATIQNALKTFKGIERRFEFKGTFKGADIFDDYGHHPTEIQKTLIVAQKRAQKKLHVIFQPHRFTRTKELWNDFVNTFVHSEVATLYITDIYPASEQPIEGITSMKLAEAIQQKKPSLKVKYFKSYDEIESHVRSELQKDDLLITVGAGKINQIGDALAKQEA